LNADGPRRPGVRRAVQTLVIVCVVVLAAVLVRTFVAAPYFIPSASMEPTLHGCTGCNNDHVLVNKLSYKLHGVHRGDVIVFNRPSTWHVGESHLIKRVIGLPGDTLTVRKGKLYVNGLELQEPYLDSACGPMTSLGESPAKARTKYGPVPKDDVFVMGDNRCDSSDSRAFGPVPESDIVGRAFVIIWPLGRLHYL
jgi:signal peptidase I